MRCSNALPTSSSSSSKLCRSPAKYCSSCSVTGASSSGRRSCSARSRARPGNVSPARPCSPATEGQRAERALADVPEAAHVAPSRCSSTRLGLEAAGVAAETAARAQHAMARHDDRQRIGGQRRACGARGVGAAGARRDVAVGGRLAVRDLGRRAQDLAPEAARQSPVEWHVEDAAVAIEVFVQLAPGLGQRRARGAQHPGRDALGELLQHCVLVFGGQAHAHETLARRPEEDRAERRVVALEGDVDQPRALGRPGEVAAHPLPRGGSGAIRLAQRLLQWCVLVVVAHACETRRAP